MPLIDDFTADKEEAPDTATAVAQAPRPIIPPPPSLSEQPHYLSDAEQEAIWQQAIHDPANRIIREPTMRERIVNSSFMRRLRGPTPIEQEFRQEQGMGSTGSPGEIAETLLKFTGTAPPPIAEPIRNVTNPLINLIPNETAKGVVRGSRELVMSLPGMVATGQILPSSSAVLAAFAGQAVWNLPEQKEAFDRAMREGNKAEASQIATEAFGMGTLLTAGAGLGAATSRTGSSVVMPETLRELANEPSTTGAPNAIQERSTAETVRGMPEQPVENAQLPAEKGGAEVPPGGIPPRDTTGAPRAEEAGAAEVPLKPQEVTIKARTPAGEEIGLKMEAGEAQRRLTQRKTVLEALRDCLG